MMSIEEMNELFDSKRFAAAFPTSQEAADALRRFGDALPTVEQIEKSLRGNFVEHSA